MRIVEVVGQRGAAAGGFHRGVEPAHVVAIDAEVEVRRGEPGGLPGGLEQADGASAPLDTLHEPSRPCRLERQRAVRHALDRRVAAADGLLGGSTEASDRAVALAERAPHVAEPELVARRQYGVGALLDALLLGAEDVEALRQTPKLIQAEHL